MIKIFHLFIRPLLISMSRLLTDVADLAGYDEPVTAPKTSHCRCSKALGQKTDLNYALRSLFSPWPYNFFVTLPAEGLLFTQHD